MYNCITQCIGLALTDSYRLRVLAISLSLLSGPISGYNEGKIPLPSPDPIGRMFGVNRPKCTSEFALSEIQTNGMFVERRCEPASYVNRNAGVASVQDSMLRYISEG